MNKYLVVTFINETRILGFVGEDGDTLTRRKSPVSTYRSNSVRENMQGNLFVKSRTRVFDWFRAMGL